MPAHPFHRRTDLPTIPIHRPASNCRCTPTRRRLLVERGSPDAYETAEQPFKVAAPTIAGFLAGNRHLIAALSIANGAEAITMPRCLTDGTNTLIVTKNPLATIKDEKSCSIDNKKHVAMLAHEMVHALQIIRANANPKKDDLGQTFIGTYINQLLEAWQKNGFDLDKAYFAIPLEKEGFRMENAVNTVLADAKFVKALSAACANGPGKDVPKNDSEYLSNKWKEVYAATK